MRAALKCAVRQAGSLQIEDIGRARRSPVRIVPKAQGRSGQVAAAEGICAGRRSRVWWRDGAVSSEVDLRRGGVRCASADVDRAARLVDHSAPAIADGKNVRAPDEKCSARNVVTPNRGIAKADIHVSAVHDDIAAGMGDEAGATAGAAVPDSNIRRGSEGTSGHLQIAARASDVSEDDKKCVDCLSRIDNCGSAIVDPALVARRGNDIADPIYSIIP